jgi:membrane peptidoglycan carboxypeptidase
MKPFVVAAALAAGMSPKTTFNAPANMNFKGKDFKGCDGPIVQTKSWPVKGGGNGKIDMYTAAANSVNTYFVQLEQAVGLCNVLTMAESLGVPIDWTRDQVPSFVLGTKDIAPLTLAAAYAAFGARGVFCEPVVIASIKDRNGNDIPTSDGNCKQVLAPEVADGVNAVLGRAFKDGTAQASRISGFTASGKTGTTENGSSGWLVGYTPDIVGIAMVAWDSDPYYKGYWEPRKPMGDDGNPEAPSMSGTVLSTGVRLNGYGAQDAGPIWKAAMTPVVPTLPGTAFTPISKGVANGKPLNPPSVANMDAATAKATLEAAGFFVDVTNVYDASPAGTYLGTSNCQRFLGGTCTQTFSQGPRPEDTAGAPVVNTGPR